MVLLLAQVLSGPSRQLCRAQSILAGGRTIPVECRERNKAHPELEVWTVRDSYVVDSLETVPDHADIVNRYGSLSDGARFEARGRFYATKRDGRWYIADPEGCPHIDAAVVSVNRPKHPSRKSRNAFMRQFGSVDEWMDQTAALILRNGFNGVGNWSDTDAVRAWNSRSGGRVLTYCPNAGFMSSYAGSRGLTTQLAGHQGYPRECIPVFDPAFEAWCDSTAAVLAARFRDDPAVLGYFSDNELPFGKWNLEGYLGLPDDDPGHAAALRWLGSKGRSVADIDDSLRLEFAGVVAERYYSTVAGALRRHDPGHMYLGSRLHGSAKYVRQVYQAAGRHCDVISINYYGRWAVTQKDLERWENWTDCPFLITEFYTKGEDSGLANTSGAGWRVRTQEDRGIHYENFALTLLQSRSCVGWQWFRYIDNDPGGRGADPSNSDANKGIVDILFRPYQDLLKHMKRVNEVRYRLIEN